MRQVTHALLTRPPLSQITFPPERIKVKCFARLACVRHAASVHPEPGSNSHVFVFGLVGFHRLASFLPFYCGLFPHLQLPGNKVFWMFSFGLSTTFKNFQGFTYCSVVKVLFCSFLTRFCFPASAATLIFYHIACCLSTAFFIFFIFYSLSF